MVMRGSLGIWRQESSEWKGESELVKTEDKVLGSSGWFPSGGGSFQSRKNRSCFQS